MTDNDYLTDEERHQDEEYNPEGFRFFMAIMASIGMLTMLALGVYALFIGFCAIPQHKTDKNNNNTMNYGIEIDTNFSQNFHIFDNKFMDFEKVRYIYDCIYIDGNEYAQSELYSDSPYEISIDGDFHEVTIGDYTLLLRFKRKEYIPQ